MKKQLLIAAVAATMTSAAMADISIAGDAKFEYFNDDYSGSTTDTNQTNTEVNLNIKGSNGDTKVVMDLELNTHDSTNNANTLDIEDLYMTTKVGMVDVKAGNYATGTSAILGEIDEGSRATNKVTLSTTYNGVKFYAGNTGGSTATVGNTELSTSMFAGVSGKVAGWTLEAKKLDATDEAYKIAGEVSGLGIRLETKNAQAANSDVTFGQLDYTINDVALTYAFLDVDNTDSLVGETDSAIFAVENGGKATARDNKQISAKGAIAGNTVTVKSGSIDKGISATKDLDYAQVAVSRALAAGSTLALTYTDKDHSATEDRQTFEIDLSVKF
ncbi:hypothetical protein R5P06_06035 [Candidatus Thioglobus autotrophicus]|uniref:hypothetical protein n=1 Tax=Candidatus Thioglobus autotrophicus TaxID=1705394 RepID=UPI00299CFDA2|nr:hypothetical protein [Candidatus Thioglobus autotrophicus]WPE16107.1 hypothetical protein R5P06_06035 [Candidatus Thioglobus autotrophicus]